MSSGNAQTLEAWDIHNRIHLYLLDAVPDIALAAVSASKGRTVSEQFAHIHNVRLMWLQSAQSAAIAGLEKLDKTAITRANLVKALTDSSEAIRSLLDSSLSSDGRIKGFKPHATAFFAYLISHESHHRGQIMLTLKQAGFPADKKVAYGLWEWGVR